jgi:hypothetical protein
MLSIPHLSMPRRTLFLKPFHVQTNVAERKKAGRWALLRQ